MSIHLCSIFLLLFIKNKKLGEKMHKFFFLFFFLLLAFRILHVFLPDISVHSALIVIPRKDTILKLLKCVHA
jgi:hypothetical protein